jgi:hypothetical protein
MNDHQHKGISGLKGKREEAFPDLPKNYFDQLAENVEKRLYQDQKQRTIRIKTFTITGIAAGFLIIFGFSLFLFLQNPDSDAERHYADSNKVFVMKDSMKETGVVKDGIEADISDTAGLFVGQAGNESAKESDIFDELDDIPDEVIIEYLYSYDEFEF